MSGAGQGSAGNVIAAVCSFFIPGLGQLVQGRVGMALAMFLLALAIWIVSFGMFGWIINLVACLEAAVWKGGR
jgi:TM2 domain-containing membrane protein YozV